MTGPTKPLAARAAVVSTISALLALLVSLGVLPATTNLSGEAQAIAAVLSAGLVVGTGVVHYFASRGVVKAAAASSSPVVPADAAAGLRTLPSAPEAPAGDDAEALVDAALVEANTIHPADVEAPAATGSATVPNHGATQ